MAVDGARALALAGSLLAAGLGGCGGNKSAGDKSPPVAAATDDGGVPLRQCGKPPELRWPLRGREGRDWTITNYVDVDPGAGAVRDYTGASGADAKTYDGHAGVDIDVSSFRQVDANVPVIAAAPGEVIEIEQGQPDRNMGCTGKWNFIRVRHASGYVLTYGHLKKHSASVKVGKQVSDGAVLAVVGSSGCSTQPHVHLEVRDCNGKPVSPFATRMWKSVHDYEPMLTLMDVMIRPGGHAGLETLKDPLPNPRRVPAGSRVGFGVSAAGGVAGDRIGVVIVQPDGKPFQSPEQSFDKVQRHTYWYWNYTLPSERGRWRVEVMVNGDRVRTLPLDVY